MVLVVISAIFWFILAVLLALIEIEVEGKFGWAEKLPTWYRKNNFPIGKRPMTGYHLFMTIFLFLIIHLGFFLGLRWNWGAELMLIAAYVIFISLWDFLWFVFNPYYGIKNYRKEKIWWFSKSKWVADMFPFDYVCSLIGCLILALVASLINNNFELLLREVYTILIFIALAIISIFFAPSYHRWYKRMRKKDDRKSVGIFH